MTSEAIAGIVTTLVLAVVGAAWAVIMREIKAQGRDGSRELAQMRAEIRGEISAIAAKIDLHVLDRLGRAERDVRSLRQSRHEHANMLTAHEGRLERLEQDDEGRRAADAPGGRTQ